MKEFRKTFAQINLRKVQENFCRFRDWLEPGAFLCPMVKANAYGLGDLAVAKALLQAGAGHFGVSLIEEGQRLREVVIDESILVFSAFSGSLATRAIIEGRLTPVVGDQRSLDALMEALPNGAQYSIHVKFNSGMNRLGFDISQAERLYTFFKKQNRLQVSGICSHLMEGEDFLSTEGFSAAQVEKFKGVVDLFSDITSVVHLLNSAAIREFQINTLNPLVSQAAHIDRFWLKGGRPGIGLYGGLAANKASVSLGLSHVLDLHTEVAVVRRIGVGESVSYGGRWKSQRNSCIAALPCGYGDGVPRLLSNQGEVLIRGQRVPMIGVICMDYMLIDLTEISKFMEIRPGEPVVLIGQQEQGFIGLEEWAQMSQTISYEILTGLGPRLPRHYVW